MSENRCGAKNNHPSSFEAITALFDEGSGRVGGGGGGDGGDDGGGGGGRGGRGGQDKGHNIQY